MKKEVLILCTGNSCRSIIAEAIINKYLNVKAYSAGANPSRKVNENAKKLLKSIDAWDDGYYSKSIDEFKDKYFDLVVTVCDNAKESCPVYPNTKKQIHIPFDDPDGKDYEAFEEVLKEMKERLLPVVEKLI